MPIPPLITVSFDNGVMLRNSSQVYSNVPPPTAQPNSVSPNPDNGGKYENSQEN